MNREPLFLISFWFTPEFMGREDGYIGLKNVYRLNIRNVLNQLSGHINDSIMTELNYRVDYLKQSLEKVAQDFLMEQSLYRKPLNGNGDVVRIGSKIFGEQFP